MRSSYRRWMVAAGAVALLIVLGPAFFRGHPQPDAPEARPSPPVEEPITVSSRPRPNLRGYSALVLSNDPLIQNELALSGDQVAALRGEAAAFLESLRPVLAIARTLKELDAEAQSAEAARMQREQQAVIERFDQRAVALLADAQIHRLEQIAFQLRGEQALQDESVVVALALNARQRAEVARFREELRGRAAEVQARHARREMTRRQLQSELAALRDACLRKYETLLTNDQTRVLSELRGPRLSFTTEQVRWQLRPANAIASARDD
jgi:hypothetical protein